MPIYLFAAFLERLWLLDCLELVFDWGDFDLVLDCLDCFLERDRLLDFEEEALRWALL